MKYILKQTENLGKQKNIIVTPKNRNSNIELLRIILMIFIVAHHFALNGGLAGEKLEY